MLGRAPRAEQKRALAGIEPVGFIVNDVVPAVEQQAHGKADVQRAQPEHGGVKNVALPERQHVKRNGREPQARSGRLQKEQVLSAKGGSLRRHNLRVQDASSAPISGRKLAAPGVNARIAFVIIPARRS